MKKLIYTLAFAIVLAASFTSCTDENVTPRTADSGTGGHSTDPR